MPVVSVVVMAFNEANNLEAVVQEILGVLRESGCQYEVLVIDDGSSDKTGAIADELATTDAGVRILHHNLNRGLGGVYRSGFAHSRGEFVTFFPADGQFPATIIPQFLEEMRSTDLVLGYLPDQKRSLIPRFLSAIERVIYRCLFGRMPKFQGVLMVRRRLLEDIALRSTGRGWAVVMELILRTTRLGYRVKSTPTAMRPRLSGQSKVNNLRTIWANFCQALALYRLLP